MESRFKKLVPECFEQNVLIDGVAQKDAEGNAQKAKVFEGFIELRIPGASERVGFLADVGLYDMEGNQEKRSERVKLIMACYEKAKPLIQKVEIKRVKDGKEFNTAEELDHCSALNGACMEIGRLLLDGFELGN